MFRRIVAVAVVSIAMVGWAHAATGDAPTNLNIHLKDGRVYGMLTGPPVCRAAQPVDLVVNGLDIATAITDVTGRYSFTYDPAAGEHIRTKFDGAIVGVHPDTVVCRSSASRMISVGGVFPSSGSNAERAETSRGAAFTGPEIGKAAAAGALLLISGAFLLAIGHRRL
jgi:hypothetical protein